MAENKDIFVNGDSSTGAAGGEQSQSVNDGLKNAPNNEKFGSLLKRGLSNAKTGLVNSAKDYSQDLTKSLKDLKDGSIKSLKDRFLGKQDRNSQGSNEFIVQERSTANRHKDAITGILKDTYNGNLFDAGLSAIQLYNFGTKWKFIMDQVTDKDSYSFKYWYYLEDYQDKDRESNTIGSEGNEVTTALRDLKFLDTIEDPTLLGYTFKIDYSSSPLFQPVFEGAEIIAAEDDDRGSTSPLKDFIKKNQPNYPEMKYALTYLSEFANDISKVFMTPESLGTELGYKKTMYKNHYIAKVDGLDKLDEPWVEYKEDNKEAQSLVITLNEDIRMFSNRLLHLYQNLTFSKSGLKKLIPENLLRFNLYIKVADYRSFTRNTTESDIMREAMRNQYSRVIYELKDCEFFFDKSINPSSMSMGGFSDVNKEYATLQLRIKYRKVNRILYSSFFSADLGEMVIGDKFHEPNVKKYYEMAKKTQLIPDIKSSSTVAKKRTATDNNIPVEPTIKERFDSLKNNGLVAQDDDDTAITRFAKAITNDAVKAGAQVVDEGLKKAKTAINDFTVKNSIKNLLQEKVISKIKKHNLGNRNSKPKALKTIPKKDLHPFASKKIDMVKSDLHPESSKNVTISRIELHPQSNFNTKNPTGDLHDNLDVLVAIPNENLMGKANKSINSPNEDLHLDGERNIIIPNEDLHPETNDIIIQPNGDLHNDLDIKVIEPNEDLHQTLKSVIGEPNEDLMAKPDFKIEFKEEILNTKPEFEVKIDSKNVNGVLEIREKVLSENVNDKVNSYTKEPNNNVNEQSRLEVKRPSDNINTLVNGNIDAPNEDLHPNSQHKIKKSDNYTSLEDYLKKRPKPKQ